MRLARIPDSWLHQFPRLAKQCFINRGMVNSWIWTPLGAQIINATPLNYCIILILHTVVQIGETHCGNYQSISSKISTLNVKWYCISSSVPRANFEVIEFWICARQRIINTAFRVFISVAKKIFLRSWNLRNLMILYF